jgi:hypothetical protein
VAGGGTSATGRPLWEFASSHRKVTEQGASPKVPHVRGRAVNDYGTMRDRAAYGAGAVDPDAVRALPPEKQAEVLRIAQSLKQGAEPKRPRKSGRGLWENLGSSLSAEDIDEARKEMWGDFPHNDV